MAKKRAPNNNNNNKKKSTVAAISHARLDDEDDNNASDNSSPRSSNKWKGPKWSKRGAGEKKNSKQGGKNKNSNHSNNNSDDEHLRRTIEADGCRTVIEMAADGNCLFRSLSDQLYHDYGNGHISVRREVCDFLEAHRDDFSAFLLLEEEEEDVTDFDAYVREMREHGTWGGNVELVVASRLYDRNITIFSYPNSNNSVQKGTGAPAELSAFTIHHDHDDNEHDAARKRKNRLPDILLSFHENGHYNSVRDSTNGNGRPPPPIKTYVKPSSSESAEYNDEYGDTDRDDDGEDDEYDHHDDEYHDHHRYHNNNQQQQQQQVDSDTEQEKTDTSQQSATTSSSTSSTASTVDMDEHEQQEAASTTSVVPPPKTEAAKRIKKNDACPCGSGTRYKKCCWAREKNAARVQQLQKSNKILEESSVSAQPETKDGGDDDDDDDAEVVMNGNFRVLTI
jgi:OTU-like cysteine protease/SEC-C motif